ncbi:MAG: nucleotidyltransferase domain-containing protein [Bacillota bacterium]
MTYFMPRAKQREKQLSEALNKILEAIKPLSPEKVVLFGSLCRGDIATKSDIDLLIVWETELPFLERLQKFYQAAAPDVAVDILVYTPDEINRLSRTNPFIHTALKEGRVLYEK